MAPKYGDFPVFQYQTFDSDPISFASQPVIPPERIQFTDQDADELYQSNDEGPELEIIELDGPGDDVAEDNRSKEDGMTIISAQSIVEMS